MSSCNFCGFCSKAAFIKLSVISKIFPKRMGSEKSQFYKINKELRCGDLVLKQTFRHLQSVPCFLLSIVSFYKQFKTFSQLLVIPLANMQANSKSQIHRLQILKLQTIWYSIRMLRNDPEYSCALRDLSEYICTLSTTYWSSICTVVHSPSTQSLWVSCHEGQSVCLHCH